MMTRALNWVAALTMLIAAHLFLLKWFSVPASIAIAEAIVHTAFVALAALSLVFMLRYYRPVNFQVVFIVVWCFFLGIVCSYGTKYSLQAVYPEADTTLYQRTLPLRVLIDMILLTGFTGFFYYVHSVSAVEKQKEMQLLTERQAKESELNFLRQQLQPHFLFNTLNSINALINIDPQKAQTMTHTLSEFLRGSLARAGNTILPLSQELRYLELYLQIEQVRFGNRLKVIISVEQEAYSAMIPAFSLQPLVENAIKFGVYDTIDDVEITVSAKRTPNALLVKITNPFDPSTSAGSKGTGFGLSSLRRKLYLLYSRQDLLSVSSDAHVFEVTLLVPQYV